MKRVSDARDEGDLKENAGYHAARDELGKIDGRVQQLVDMLERAEVGETPADDGVVEPGMKVTVKLVGLDLTETFLFGAREMAGDDIKVYSPQSPLGQAIDGAKRGETVTYTLPNGKDQKAEIVEAVPYVGLTAVSAPCSLNARLLNDVVAVLPQPVEHLLGVVGTLGLELQPHLHLADVSEIEVRSCETSRRWPRRRRARPAGARAHRDGPGSRSAG